MADQTPVTLPVLDEIASARRDIDLFAGWLTALPNPDRILREQPQRGIRIYGDMQRDGHIRSVFQTRRLAVLAKQWEIQPVSDDAADKAVAQSVSDALINVRTPRAKGRPRPRLRGFERARFQLLDGIFKGFAVGEVMWGVRDGRIVPAEIRRRGQHRFMFDIEGKPRLLTLANMIEGEALPERKFLLFQYEADPENPYGVGVGQSCYWPWWFKKHGIKFWMSFCDRFGTPFPLGKFPPGTSKEVRDEFLELVTAFTQESAGTCPDNCTIELLEAKRSAGQDVYRPLAEYMDAEISKAVLGQTATTQGTPGALGSEQARADVREDYVAADADLLDEVITDQLIRWIVDFNFGPDVPAPWLHTTMTSEPDIMDQWRMSFRDRNLQGMGLPIPASYARDTYSVPEPQGDDDILEPPTPFGDSSAIAQGGLGFGETVNGLFAEADRQLAALHRRGAR